MDVTTQEPTAVQERPAPQDAPTTTAVDLVDGVVSKFRSEIDRINTTAKNLVIADEQTAREAVDLAAQAIAVGKRLESERMEITRPLDQRKKEIMAVFDKYQQPLNTLAETLKTKLGAYKRAEQRRRDEEAARMRAEEERRAIEQAEALKAAGNSVAADMVLEIAAETTQTIAEAAPVTAAGSMATSTTVRRWVHEVVDVAKVPRKYLVVNDTAIRAAIRDGVRDIAGVRIYQQESERIA